MDFQRHGFWIILGVVFAAELAFLGLFVLPTDGKVSKLNKSIQANVGSLKNIAQKDFIPNSQVIEQIKGKKSLAAKDLIKAVVYLAVRDEHHLERKWAEEGVDLARIATRRNTQETELTNQLTSSAGVYKGVKLVQEEDRVGGGTKKGVQIPTAPGDVTDVDSFYRKWWTMEMVLEALARAGEAVLKSTGNQIKLYELTWGTDREEKELGGYVKSHIQVSVKVRVQVTEVGLLLQTFSNTDFIAAPAKLDLKMVEPDPSRIDIPVDQDEKEPSEKELRERISKKRPVIEATFTIEVSDLDREKVLEIGRRYRPWVGQKPALEALIEELKKDESFLKSMKKDDKDKELGKMVDQLMQPPKGRP